MPFSSESQRRKFAALVKQGKMSQATFDEWQAATGNKKLPERIGPKKASKPAASYIKKRFGI